MVSNPWHYKTSLFMSHAPELLCGPHPWGLWDLVHLLDDVKKKHVVSHPRNPRRASQLRRITDLTRDITPTKHPTPTVCIVALLHDSCASTPSRKNRHTTLTPTIWGCLSALNGAGTYCIPCSSISPEFQGRQ
jgi:hypothetical protein